jgi:hypothetical protein
MSQYGKHCVTIWNATLLCWCEAAESTNASNAGITSNTLRTRHSVICLKNRQEKGMRKKKERENLNPTVGARRSADCKERTSRLYDLTGQSLQKAVTVFHYLTWQRDSESSRVNYSMQATEQSQGSRSRQART